jgi:S-adenosylmethionine decarboxylase
MTEHVRDALAGLDQVRSGLLSPSRNGKAVLGDLYGVSRATLESAADLEAITKDALRVTGFNVLSSLVYTFPDGGAGTTGLFILSESHAAFHSYPEFGYLALDVFACGASDPCAVLESMARSLEARHMKVTVVQRSFDREQHDPALTESDAPVDNLDRHRYAAMAAT